MKYKPYMHIQRFGHREVQGIEHGTCFIFPKLDGTNASVWLDIDANGYDIVRAGSRTRQLSLESDNAGFYNWVCSQQVLYDYFKANPHHRLYGEWLVPHTLKTYRQDVWRRFWIFDVAVPMGDSEVLLSYNTYSLELEKFGLDYITPIMKAENVTEEWLTGCLDRATFLVDDGKGHGEGVVIKNYDFHNQAGDQIWAKLVRQEFKEQNAKAFGIADVSLSDPIEMRIVEKFLTESMIEKVYAKIVVQHEGWSSKRIPQLLETCYYDLVSEEIWSILKEFNIPTINFRSLKAYTIQKIKLVKKECF